MTVAVYSQRRPAIPPDERIKGRAGHPLATLDTTWPRAEALVDENRRPSCNVVEDFNWPAWISERPGCRSLSIVRDCSSDSAALS